MIFSDSTLACLLLLSLSSSCLGSYTGETLWIKLLNYRGHNLTPNSLTFWLLQSFYSLYCNVSWVLGVRQKSHFLLILIWIFLGSSDNYCHIIILMLFIHLLAIQRPIWEIRFQSFAISKSSYFLPYCWVAYIGFLIVLDQMKAFQTFSLWITSSLLISIYLCRNHFLFNLICLFLLLCLRESWPISHKLIP